jgi:SAM-dependent methyltransferase
LSELEGTYIQYGCGPSCPEGWINYDASPTLRLQRLRVIGKLFRRGSIEFSDDVRFGDIVKGLPVADGSAQGVYASHVLEHLSLADFWTALHNTFRILKPGGIFRLVVPDLEIRARTYVEKLKVGDAEANTWFMRTSNLGLEHRKRGLEAWARGVFGNSAHLWMWDERSMTAALEKVGFIGVRRCRFNDSKDEAFRLVEDASRFYDDSADVEECAMEAIKPKV